MRLLNRQFTLGQLFRLTAACACLCPIPFAFGLADRPGWLPVGAMYLTFCLAEFMLMASAGPQPAAIRAVFLSARIALAHASYFATGLVSFVIAQQRYQPSPARMMGMVALGSMVLSIAIGLLSLSAVLAAIAATRDRRARVLAAIDVLLLAAIGVWLYFASR